MERLHIEADTRAKVIGKILRRAGLYLTALAISAAVLAPFIWLVLSSISTRVELTSIPLHWLPGRVNLENYREIFLGGPRALQTNLDLRRAGFNSLFVAGSSTLLCLFAGALGAYAFTRLRFKGQGTLAVLILATQLLPQVVIIIPLYMVMRRLGLLDHLPALILADCAFILPLIIWLMRGFFLAVPNELEDAARIDGCSRVSTIFRIILPLASPGLVACGIFTFIISWNEFFSAFIFSSTLRAKTLSVLISEFGSKVGVDYVAMSAAGVIASLPPVLLALFFQRYIVQGLTGGAVKG